MIYLCLLRVCQTLCGLFHNLLQRYLGKSKLHYKKSNIFNITIIQIIKQIMLDLFQTYKKNTSFDLLSF